jgi:hypothetical protein
MSFESISKLLSVPIAELTAMVTRCNSYSVIPSMGNNTGKLQLNCLYEFPDEIQKEILGEIPSDVVQWSCFMEGVTFQNVMTVLTNHDIRICVMGLIGDSFTMELVSEDKNKKMPDIKKYLIWDKYLKGVTVILNGVKVIQYSMDSVNERGSITDDDVMNLKISLETLSVDEFIRNI